MNGEEVIRKIRVSLIRFLCTDFLAPNYPSLVIRMSSILLVQGGYIYHRFLMTCLGMKQEGVGDV